MTEAGALPPWFRDLAEAVRLSQQSSPSLMRYPRRCLTVAEDPSGRRDPGRLEAWHWVMVVVALGLAGWLYVWLAGVLMAGTNQDPLAQDQKNNMRLALEAREALDTDLSRGLGPAIRQWLPHRSDGVVAPLWPWVAARVARDGHVIEQASFGEHTPADRAFFARGKWLNVWISGVFLAAVGLWMARRWTVLGTVNCVLLAMLGALLPRAVAFQPEPLYFILFFLSWVAGLRLCVRNSLGGYAVFGLLCGLAGLAKSSIQPLMVVWFGAMAVRFGFGLWRPSDRWSPARHGIGVVVWGAVFLLVMAPRMAHAHERWGRPFFAYPNVWMWMDDFPTGYAWMGAHPDRRALDAVPADRWPSFAAYRATHPPSEMVGRLRDGVLGEHGSLRTWLAPKGSGRNAGTPEKPWKRLLEPRGGFLAGLTAISLVAAALAWTRRPAAPRPVVPRGPEALACALMVVGTVTLLTLLYGWYTPIGRGDRFMLSLWLPLVFSLTAWAEASVRLLGSGLRRWVYTGLQAVLLAGLLWRVSELVRAPFFETKLL
jgi:hypothetical protein